MVGALASYYRKIPVAHVEAGLRSGNIYSPWPEEVNRRIVSTIAAYRFSTYRTRCVGAARRKYPERPHLCYRQYGD